MESTLKHQEICEEKIIIIPIHTKLRIKQEKISHWTKEKCTCNDIYKYNINKEITK